MDENYLDDLLNDISKNDKPNSNIDSSVDADSSIDIDLSDLDDITLDELDDLDELDLGDLDVDDIDFDDVDVTKINKKAPAKKRKEPKDELSLDDLIEEATEESISQDFVHDEEDDAKEQEDDIDALLGATAGSEDVFDDALNIKDEDEKIISFENEEVELGESHEEGVGEAMADEKDVLGAGESELSDGPAAEAEEEDFDNMDLDDLFSALGIEDESAEEDSPYTAGEDELDELLEASMAASAELDDLADIEERVDESVEKKSKGKKAKKSKQSKEGNESNNAGSDGSAVEEKGKKTIKEILFGEPDEDDIEEEKAFQEKKEKKKIEKEQKKALNETKKQEKKEQKAIKDQEANKKKAEKLEVKKQKDAEMLAEMEEEAKTEKRVSNVTVIIVFVLFAALAAGVIFGAKQFNYGQIIKRAADYFDRQRYRLAYDEVSGVEVKPDDQELKDRIYTVMYVERLYESYGNNMKLGKYDKALDALLRGIEKYDEHHEEAIELGIEQDLDFCKTEIISALQNDFNVSLDDAYYLMGLDGQDYINALRECCKGYNIEE